MSSYNSSTYVGDQMKTLIALLLLLFSVGASASPFVVADVVTGVAQCGVVLDGAAKVLIPSTGTTCKYDLTAALPVGPHTVTMTALTVNDPVWGTQESGASSPLAFTKPGTPAAPSGLQLSP